MDSAITIIGLNHEGAGIGHLQDGRVIFVPGALPGEQVLVEVVSVKRNYARGRLVEVVKASPDRVLPPCPEAASCGGCDLQHLDYRAQLHWKRRLVIDALQRLGHLRDIPVLPVLGMANPWGYRNKVRLHVCRGRLGFYRPGSHELAPFSCCPLLPPGLLEAARAIASLLPGLPPGLQHVTLRQGLATGELLVVLEALPEWQGDRELAEKLAGRFPELVGVVSLAGGGRSRSGPKDFAREPALECSGWVKTGGKEARRARYQEGFVPRRLGGRPFTLYGRDYLEERLGDLRFYISATTFFQVNSAQAEVLYNQAAAFAGLQGGEEVLDAYCGSGAIALWLSRQAGRVTGVEVVPEAIVDAWRNAILNNLANVRFRTGAAEAVLPRLAGKGYRPEVIILDPPRAGCDRRVLAAVATMEPRRVVYISCNPSTLARDLAHLREAGFKPGPVQPVDMFPHTHHVECCCFLVKERNNSR
ncbi:23S rRNA (uracil(1939)-C(5))-methyltransferase RlmD [Neomoorella thermoacetica]|uniref:23S rRNA (uracil(1939)-C(5))-methyltransferase RlmD n=1 Tax=Neomoorella thermoacetica TaxID=1525 RepID=UPI0009083D1B|nr:23S rRNA (uracil(1939)-C(5))-methyltransferase RlmD [Moorella thermoacetica]APC09129.1 23S rRNA (uracil-C(5))-methyltransferase RlmCD [Moorella thermoacetica]